MTFDGEEPSMGDMLSSSSAGMGEKERRISCIQKEGLEETGRPKKKYPHWYPLPLTGGREIWPG